MKRLVLRRREEVLRGGQPFAFFVGLLFALVVGAVLLYSFWQDRRRWNWFCIRKLCKSSGSVAINCFARLKSASMLKKVMGWAPQAG